MADSSTQPVRRRLRIGVLFGGRSGEHEVSLHSAQAVMSALEQAGHEVVPIGITTAGRWLVAGDPMRALSSGESSGETGQALVPEPGHPSELDLLFPVLHGTYGEDGTVQGLFELASVP